MNAGKVVNPNKDAAAEPLSKDDGSGMVASLKGSTGPGLRALGLTWAVLDVQPLGYGFVAWIKVGPGAQNIGVAARGPGLRIGETGQVPEIEVENLGDTAVLVPAHLVLSGGWQTRAVERSAVVPARHTARVPVKCIEAGRWAPRDERTGSTFEVAERTSVRTRWSTAVNMSEQLTRHGRFTAEQSAVWQHVEEELARTPEPSHTRSYEAYLRGVKRRHMEAAHAVRVRPPAEANAAVVFLRGGGVWMEAYPTPSALVEQADDLLADLFDASAKNETALADAPPIEALLGLLWDLPTREVDRIAGTLGAPRVIDGVIELPEWSPLAAVTGSLLTIDGALVHLSVGAPPGRPSPRQASPPAPSHRSEPMPDARHATHPQADAARLTTGPLDARSHGAVDAPAKPAGLHAVPSLAATPGRSMAENPLGGTGFSSLGRSSAGCRDEPAPPSRSDARVVAFIPRGHAPIGSGPKISRETMRAVYERARDLVPEMPIAPEDVRGYRLLRALDGNVSWVDIRVGGDAYAVLGSHDRCDLVLGDDAGIWLRHLLAGCVRLPDGNLAVRMIDLKTDIPFYLEDDMPQWSVTASGPFAIRLGRHVICGFPLGDSSALRTEPPAGAAAVDSSASAAAPAQTFPSLIRIDTPPPVRRRVGDPFTIVPSAPVSQIQDLIGPSTSEDHVRVTLERGGMGASVEIPSSALESGVLLGRALNCFDGGLRRIFCDAVSRAHVLLLADQGEVFALDLCTTNGTRVAGRRIRRYRLANEGATLELGKKVLFRWHRRGPEPAPVNDGGTSGPADR